MPRSFDLAVESSASVQQIFATFGDPEYWRARLAAFSNGTATLTSLSVDPDGAVNVLVTISLLGDRLPKLITQLHRGDLQMVRNELWSPIDRGQVHGDINVTFSGAPLSAAGIALIAPAPHGCRLKYTTTVAANVPLVGGRIESYIGSRTGEEIAAIQRFTNEWITENS